MRKTLLARSSPTRVTDEVSMIDLPTDGSLPDGAFNDDHLGTLDAVRGAVHPISKGSDMSRSQSRRSRTGICAVPTALALVACFRGSPSAIAAVPRFATKKLSALDRNPVAPQSSDLDDWVGGVGGVRKAMGSSAFAADRARNCGSPDADFRRRPADAPGARKGAQRRPRLPSRSSFISALPSRDAPSSRSGRGPSFSTRR